MELLINSLPLLGRGTVTTIYLSVAAIVLSTVLGLVFALFQLFGGLVLRFAVEVYLYVMRGVPLLVLLFAMYYATPYAGIQIDPATGGVMVIAAYFGAFMTEVFRGAVLSVATAQWEAGKAIGLTDLTYVGRQIVERTLAPFEIFGFVALIYFIVCFALSRLGNYLERRLDYVN